MMRSFLLSKLVRMTVSLASTVSISKETIRNIRIALPMIGSPIFVGLEIIIIQ